MILSFRQIQAFLAVAERRSFSRAAEDLNLSQPALSERVRELETSLGLKLFSRTTRSVQLTSDGERLLTRAQRAIGELDSIVLELQDRAALRRGSVSIACVPAVAAYLVPQAIARFRSIHPGVKVELSELTSAEVEARVLDGTADFGICGQAERKRELDRTLIAKDPFVALVTLDHPLAKRKWITLAMMQRYPLVVMRRGSNVRSTLEEAFDAARLRLQPAYETTHHYSVLGMVEAGLGIGALPLMTVAALPRSNVSTVRIAKPAIEREIGIVTKRGIAASPAAAQFMRFVQDTFRSTAILRQPVL